MSDTAWYLGQREKTAAEKQAIYETLRHGYKALKGALRGGTDLQAPPGVFHAARRQAATAGTDLMSKLQEGGIQMHRARVKSPASIAAKGLTEVPDDLLGMQMYGKGPGDVENALRKLRSVGVDVQKVSPKARPGYHGVNIKGRYQDVPIELQVSPSRTSNAGQILEHALGYKQLTEAPRANWFDKWVGREVAPRMVNWDRLGPLDPSWINENEAVLSRMA